MGGALEVGYLYVALTPPSIAWRAAAVSRILRKVQSSCMIFIFTVGSYRSDFFFFLRSDLAWSYMHRVTEALWGVGARMHAAIIYTSKRRFKRPTL